jgi:hypothetical protein
VWAFADWQQLKLRHFFIYRHHFIGNGMKRVVGIMYEFKPVNHQINTGTHHLDCGGYTLLRKQGTVYPTPNYWLSTWSFSSFSQ